MLLNPPGYYQLLSVTVSYCPLRYRALLLLHLPRHDKRRQVEEVLENLPVSAGDGLVEVGLSGVRVDIHPHADGGVGTARLRHLRVWGLGCRVSGVGRRVSGVGCRE